jgi:hypothetical protein
MARYFEAERGRAGASALAAIAAPPVRCLARGT